MAKQTDSLTLLRQTVKGHIWNNRKVNGYPLCPICGKPFDKQEPSMHEVFVTRAVVRGCPEETQLLVHVPQNVVLVHEGDCHINAQHYHAGKISCALQLLKYEGFVTIVEWMDLIDSRMRTTDNIKRILLEEAMELFEAGINVE